MNRRVRNRTHGGVGGRRGDPASYPIDNKRRIDEKWKWMIESGRQMALLLA